LFSPDGSAVMAEIEQYDSRNMLTFRYLVWNLGTDNTRWRLKLPGDMKVLALSPGGGSELASASDSALEFRNVATSRVVAVMQRPSITQLTYLPNGRSFVVADGTESGRVEVWRRHPLEFVRTLISGGEPIDEITASPSSQFVAVRSLNGPARVFDVTTGATAFEAFNTSEGESLVGGMSFTRNSNLLFAGNEVYSLTPAGILRAGCERFINRSLIVRPEVLEVCKAVGTRW